MERVIVVNPLVLKNPIGDVKRSIFLRSITNGKTKNEAIEAYIVQFYVSWSPNMGIMGISLKIKRLIFKMIGKDNLEIDEKQLKIN